MGEIAEMMLEGDLCEGCGCALDGPGQGFPRYCSKQCARNRGAEPTTTRGPTKSTKISETGNIVLSDKLFKRLKSLVIWGTSDGSLTPAKGESMYAGAHWEGATRQHEKLQRMGFVERRSPHNPVHKDRAVLTQKGIDFLKSRGIKA